MNNQPCKNCGAYEGLHHYDTNQCPLGGKESHLNQKEVWLSTTYEVESDAIKQAQAALKNIVDKFDAMPDGPLGEGFVNGDFFFARDALNALNSYIAHSDNKRRKTVTTPIEWCAVCEKDQPHDAGRHCLICMTVNEIE